MKCSPGPEGFADEYLQTFAEVILPIFDSLRKEKRGEYLPAAGPEPDRDGARVLWTRIRHEC